MHRISFIHQPPPDGTRRWRAFFASCAFHGLVLCLLLGLTILYKSRQPPHPSGSAPGAPTITLEAMVIVSPPPEPVPLPTPPPITPEAIAVPAPPTHAAVLPKPPEEGVPVLAMQPGKPAPAKIHAAPHPVISHAAAAASSSFAPGLNVLPHPPYPTEAQDRGQTGTVIMNVQFDASGNVAQADVAQSSGVPLLDTATRSFIRAHWHSAAYAGQTISQPVQYALEKP